MAKKINTEMELRKVKLSDLVPYENNPRNNDEAVPDVEESMVQTGYNSPIVVSKDMVILAGHTRLKSLLDAGVEEAPVVVIDRTAEQYKKFRILDNKTGEKASWDFEKLKFELDGLDFDGFDFGFDFDFDNGKSPDVTEDDFSEDDPINEHSVKRGQIWQLGNHRLMCGDSTDSETVEKLLDGRKADIVFTDPPYLLETEGGCKGQLGKSLKKQGKEIEFISDFNPTNFLHVLPSVFNGNMNAYIFCNKELLPDYLNFAKDKRYSWNVLVWKKPNGIPIGDSHRPDIEYLILYRKNAIWNNGTSANYSRCLEFSRVQKTEENGNHPTIKPVELIANELVISSNVGSLCVDFFGGSGSTLIACEQLNRTCYMMELDERYVDVILSRWEKFTGKKAVLLND